MLFTETVLEEVLAKSMLQERCAQDKNVAPRIEK